MLRNKFFKWGSSSLTGHVVFFEVICATPLLLFALGTMYSQGRLTVISALYMAVVCSVLVAVCAGLFWYTFSLPLIKRRADKS
jgi:CHASE2 domain-containing sensor protein